MNYYINTVVGSFTVHLSYHPSPDDCTLSKFAETINQHSLDAIIAVSKLYPNLNTITDAKKIAELALPLMATNEAEIEKALYQATAGNSGAGVRLTLSLKKREIMCSSF